METKERLGAILRALRITEIVYSLSGGGDSGETTLESVVYADDGTAHELPRIPITITDSGHIVHLPDLLENIVSDAPEFDWCNGEGGHGSVYVRPFEDEEELTLECDMTYGDDDDDDDYDDEFIDGDDFDDEATSDAFGGVHVEEIAP